MRANVRNSETAAETEASKFTSFVDWINHHSFTPLFKTSQQFGSTSASLVRVRQDQVSADPATPDITIQFCRRGTTTLVANVAGQRFRGNFNAGNYVVTPPNEQIDMGGAGRAEFDVFVIDGDRARAIVETDEHGSYEKLARSFGLVGRDQLVGELINSMWQDAEAGRLGGALYADALVSHLLIRLVNLTEPVPREIIRGGLAPWQLKRLTERLAADLAGDVSLSELAELVGLSTYHLCRAFAASTGLPPHRWRVARRIERARELLIGTDLPVTEIAAQVGYDNPAQLSRVFRAGEGLSPSDFRRRMKR